MATFVSYAREDRDIALRLTDDLRAAGVDVWIDHRNIRGGDPWDEAVETALRQSPTMLVILSPDAVQSRSVMDEVSYALEEGKRVVPVLHRACKIPLRMRRLQYVELSPEYAEGLARVVSALQGVTAPPVVTPAPPPKGRPAVRAAVIFAFGGAVYGAIASYLIFKDGGFNLQGGVSIPAIIGAIVLAILGAIAGAITGGRKVRVLAAVIGCVVPTLVCVVVGGPYEYVWGGVLFGGGGSAILAASIARVVTRR